eukprot:9518099-Ditylum_brightwellii.AAC.1
MKRMLIKNSTEDNLKKLSGKRDTPSKEASTVIISPFPPVDYTDKSLPHSINQMKLTDLDLVSKAKKLRVVSVT